MAVECRKTCGLCEYIIVSELKRYRERFPSLRLWTDLLDDDPVASGNSHSNLLGYLPHSLGSGNKLPCMDKKDDCNERPLEHCADPPDGHPELNPYHAEMISDCPLRCGKCDQYAVELQQEQRLAELSDSRLQSAYDRISKIYDHLLPNRQNGIGINYANRLSQNNDGGSIGRQRISQVNGRRPQQMLRQKRQAQVYEEGSEEEWSEGNGQNPNYPNVQSNQNYPPYPQNPQNPQNYPNSPNYGQNHPSNYPNNPNNNYPQVNPNYPQVNPNSQNYGPNYPTSNQNNPQIYPSNNPSYLSPNYANGLNYPPNNDPNCAVPSASGTVVEEEGEEEMGGYRK